MREAEDAAIDLASLCNVYHHVDGPSAYFGRLRTDLEPEGRLAIVEIRGAWPIRWLVPEGHWTSPEQMEEDLASAGYRHESSFDFFPVQSFVVFRSSAPRSRA